MVRCELSIMCRYPTGFIYLESLNCQETLIIELIVDKQVAIKVAVEVTKVD